MVTIVLTIGAINLGLGFGLALLLERPINIPTPRWRWARKPKPQLTAAPRQIVESPQLVTATPEPPRFVRSVFPWLSQEWADLLAGQQVSVASFPEALLWVSHFKLSEYCDRLRQCDSQSQPETAEFPLAGLRVICGECRTQLTDWETAIRDCQERESHGDLLEQFTQWIQEPAQQLQKMEQLCEQAETETAQEGDRPPLRQHLQQIFTNLRALRDRYDDSLARLLRVEKRLEELPAAANADPGTTNLNRLGLETVIHEWIGKDPDRVRMASAILVDVDQCQQLNERHGLAVTDKVLSASLQLLVELVRKDRGFDRVARLAGQSFLIFLGDTASRNAIVGSERVRQNFGAAVFKVRELSVSVTASCAVTEWNPSESFDELVGRLRTGLTEAKKAGRNCTVVCGPDETRVAQSSRMQVQAREFAIES